MALTATLNKLVFAPGEPMVLTVETDPGERDRFTETPFTLNVSVLGVGNADVAAALREQIGDAPVNITDPGHTWVQRSDDGETFIADATA